MIGQFVNNELERLWKKAVVAYPRAVYALVFA
jgi:hypothetical protein